MWDTRIITISYLEGKILKVVLLIIIHVTLCLLFAFPSYSLFGFLLPSYSFTLLYRKVILLKINYFKILYPRDCFKLNPVVLKVSN